MKKQILLPPVGILMTRGSDLASQTQFPFGIIKKPRLVSKKISGLLAGVVFATGFLTLPVALHAQDTEGPLMPGKKDAIDNQAAILDENPAAPDSKTNKILVYGVDKAGRAVPQKLLRITNNSGQTVYPIMRDENSTLVSDTDSSGKYDSSDPTKMEYRGYIGYKGSDGKYHFGLQNGQSIIVSIPLVFWNAARIGVGTDPEYLTKTMPNPLNWDPNAERAITRSMPGPLPTGPGLITTSGTNIGDNGAVLWYRAGISAAPKDDTEDQLAEWTIRDHEYLKKMDEGRNKVPDNELIDLINYDVSNVDNLFLPLSMQAGNVWVLPQGIQSGKSLNRDGWVAGAAPEVNAWTGATGDIKTLQAKIRKFTETPNTLLGDYFPDKKGWPYYNMSTVKAGSDLKIPSGANIFAQSPLKGVHWSYGTGSEATDKYMLSSGGTDATFTNIGWAGGTPDLAESGTLHLLNEPEKLKFLKPGLLVVGKPAEIDGKPDPKHPNPIEPGTTVEKVDLATRSVTLSKPLIASSEACGFVFMRPSDDYAAIALIKLWFSWAEYYRSHWKDSNPSLPDSITVNASLERKSATLTFSEPHKELIPGMAVQGPGISDAKTEKDYPHTGEAIILEVSKDGKTAILSQMPGVNTSSGQVNAYTILAPQKLQWTDEAKKLGALYDNSFNFDKDKEPYHDPYKFSQLVYMIMASMNQIGQKNNDTICKFMQNIIGANMGYIFDQPAKETADGQMVIARIRDMIKSALRGVTDFTEFPDKMEGDKHVAWYPNPSQSTGNQKFNVFNLDPFVWFVHVELGFSGYGFSIDDDTADIGAGGATQLQITVTGTNGLVNPHEWTNQAPFGPVTVDAVYSGTVTGTTGATKYRSVVGVSNGTPITIKADSDHHLADGDLVMIDQVQGNTEANGTFMIHNVTRTTFDLFDAATGNTPVASKGTYTSGGRWAFPFHPYIDTGSDLNKVYYKVNGDDVLGTFLGTYVSGPQVSTADHPRIIERAVETADKHGWLILDEPLKGTDGKLLGAGTYSFTFSGINDIVKKK